MLWFRGAVNVKTGRVHDENLNKFVTYVSKLKVAGKSKKTKPSQNFIGLEYRPGVMDNVVNLSGESERTLLYKGLYVPCILCFLRPSLPSVILICHVCMR